jgi:hypothetical protein
MGGGQRIGDRHRNREEVPERHAAHRDERVQAPPLDELHREEPRSALLFGRMNGDDVGMIEGGNRTRLTRESLDA